MKENKNYALYLIIFLLIVFYLTVTSQNQPTGEPDLSTINAGNAIVQDNDIMEIALNDAADASSFYSQSGAVLDNPLTLDEVIEKFDSKINVEDENLDGLEKSNNKSEKKEFIKIDYSDLSKLKFQDCDNADFKVRFICHEDWKIENIDNAVIVIISEGIPIVTFTIAKLNVDVTFLGQLSKNYFNKRALYQEGFQLNRVKFSGKDAVEVSAFSKKFSDRRVLDYFFMNDSQLFAVMFAVGPTEKWDDYKFLIKKIAGNIVFDSTENLTTVRE